MAKRRRKKYTLQTLDQQQQENRRLVALGFLGVAIFVWPVLYAFKLIGLIGLTWWQVLLAPSPFLGLLALGLLLTELAFLYLRWTDRHRKPFSRPEAELPATFRAR